jgi:hypothetical protein
MLSVTTVSIDPVGADIHGSALCDLKHGAIEPTAALCGLHVERRALRCEQETKMTTIKENHLDQLTDGELDIVSGGQQLFKHEFPGAVNQLTGLRSFEPSFGPTGSIAQGEVNSNQTDNNLP